MEELKKSIYQILSTYAIEGKEFPSYKCFINVPPKRTTQSIISYIFFNPDNAYFILSKDVKNDFIENFDNLCRSRQNILQEIKDSQLPLYLKNRFSSFFSKLKEIIDTENSNFSNSKNFNIINLTDQEFNDFDFFKEKFENILKDLLTKYDPNKIIIDITGGTKLHSVILANLAKENNIAYSYLQVIENSIAGGIKASAGTERFFIIQPDKVKLNYIWIYSFPIISCFEEGLSCFYNGITKNSKFLVNIEKLNQLQTYFKEYSKNLTNFLQKNLEMMLENEFNNIKNLSRSFFDHDFLEELENLSDEKINPSKIFAFSLNKKYWYFPFEFVFKDYSNILFIRSIPDINLIEANKNNEKNTSNKIRIVLTCLSKDNHMVQQYNDLKAKFDEIKQNNDDFEMTYLFLPDKEQFLNSLADKDIAHIICHGFLESEKQIFLLEKDQNENQKDDLHLANNSTNYLSNNLSGNTSINSSINSSKNSSGNFSKNLNLSEKNNKNNNEKIKIYASDFENIGSSRFVFISACSSLTINVDWDKTIYFQMTKNGTKSIIGTHWAITQEKALKISSNFYEKFLSGAPIGMSLHEALKLENDEFLFRNYYILGNHTATLT